MFLMPVTIFRSVGTGAVVVVTVSIAVSVTLVPALLGLLGDRINWPRRRSYDQPATTSPCLLYTSDAADERSSVDLGGRRIITNKKKKKLTYTQETH